MTQAQVIGQLLKHGEAQQAQLTALQRRLEQVEATLPPQTAGAPPPIQGKAPTARR